MASYVVIGHDSCFRTYDRMAMSQNSSTSSTERGTRKQRISAVYLTVFDGTGAYERAQDCPGSSAMYRMHGCIVNHVSMMRGDGMRNRGMI